MDQNLQALALAYAAALVEYHEWLPARDSGFRGDQARFRQAQDKMYMAQEKLNTACRLAASMV
jgi:hypothetical protein